MPYIGVNPSPGRVVSWSFRRGSGGWFNKSEPTNMTNTAYSLSYWYQPLAAREHLLEICHGDYRLMRGVAQILHGTLCLEHHDELIHTLRGGVPIPRDVWRSIGISPYKLDELGILRPGWQHYVQGSLEAGVEGQCRRFQLDIAFIIRYLRLCLDNMLGPWCNLIDGKSYKTRKFESKPKAKDKPGRPMRTARTTINWQAGMAEAYRILRLAEALTSPRHRARAIQAIRCLQGIRGQPTFAMSSTREGFASYIPVYHQIDCGGRWHELNSGFQGLPGTIKGALMEGTDTVNYDIKSCHIAAAVSLAGEINAHAAYKNDYYVIIRGLDASPQEKKVGILGVRDLLKTKSAYDRIASAADLPRKVVKTCVLATLYGGGTGAGIWRTESKRVGCGAVMAALMEHHDDNYVLARKAYNRLMPLLKHIVAFAKSMESSMALVIDNPTWWRGSREKLRQMITVGYKGAVTNAAGTTISAQLPASCNDGDRVAMARRVLSHVLTGVEQHAIKHLLDALRGEEVVVLHLEHDGVVCSGPVPQVAIDYMVNHSLMSNYMKLEAKPHTSPGRDVLDTLAEGIMGQHEDDTNTTHTPPAGPHPHYVVGEMGNSVDSVGLSDVAKRQFARRG